MMPTASCRNDRERAFATSIRTASVVELRSVRPGHIPDVPFRVAPAEAATPELLLRLLEELDVVDPGERLVGGAHLFHRREVDAEREAAEARRNRPEDRLVVACGVERDRRAVRRLEDRVVLVARRGLGERGRGPLPPTSPSSILVSAAPTSVAH